jgi:hypothetical protein
MAEKRDPRFDRAAARFAGRVTVERRLNAAEAHRALVLAQSLPAAAKAIEPLLRTLCA